MVARSAVRALWLLAALLLGNGAAYVAGETDWAVAATSTPSNLEWANDVDDLLDRFDVDTTSTCAPRVVQIVCVACLRRGGPFVRSLCSCAACGEGCCKPGSQLWVLCSPPMCPSVQTPGYPRRCRVAAPVRRKSLDGRVSSIDSSGLGGPNLLTSPGTVQTHAFTRRGRVSSSRTGWTVTRPPANALRAQGTLPLRSPTFLRRRLVSKARMLLSCGVRCRNLRSPLWGSSKSRRGRSPGEHLPYTKAVQMELV